MPTFADWFAAQKQKKVLAHSYLLTSRHNHPHRLTGLSLTGSIAYTIDQRLYTPTAPANGTVRSTFEYDLDFSLTTPYTRYFEPRTPFTHALGALLTSRTFAFLHRPVRFWEAQLQINDDALPEVIGTMLRKNYTYNSGTATWTLTSTEPTEDITCDWAFDLTGGGDPASGGKNGTGDEQKTTITTFLTLDGVGADQLPDFSSIECARFPWDDPWTAEATAFNNIFTAHITAQNTLTGGGHSGTCGLTLNFLT